MSNITIREMLDHIVIVGPNGGKLKLTDAQKKEAEIFIQMRENLNQVPKGEKMLPYLLKSARGGQKWIYHYNTNEFPKNK